MAITQKNVLPFLLVGLPVGLLVLGVGSMFYTEVLEKTPAAHAEDEVRERTREFAQLLRKPVNRADLQRYVTLLSEDIGERNMQKVGALESAALLLESSMGPSNMAYKIRRQVFETDAGEVRNVVAELEGRSKPNEIVVIGAHYDSAIGSSGAVDNATGVAALMAMANALVATNNERTLRFVGFVNGQASYYQTKEMGSQVYAEDCKAKGENIVAMISLDSLGVSTDGPVSFGGNAASGGLVEAAQTAFALVSDVSVSTLAKPSSVEGDAQSDHWAFWASDYPALLVTDVSRLDHAEIKVEDRRIDFVRLEALATGLTRVVESLVNPD